MYIEGGRMRSDPLYLRLKERIRGDLLAARARGEADRLATLNDLQIQYQASRPTISKALTALAAEGLLVKQAGRGTFALSPTIPSDGAAPRTAIGYIAPITRAELPQHVFHGIDRIAHRRNCRVLMASAGDNVEQERIAAYDMIAAGVRGLIIYPTVRQGSTQAGDYLNHEDLGVPIVLIDTCTPEQGHAQVRFDNRRAGYQMAQHLLDLGHRQIGVVTYREETHHPSLEARLSGHLQALRDRNVELAPALIQRISPSAIADQLDSALSALLALPNPPTAIIGSHVPVTIEIIKRLMKRGIDVHGQIVVTGFDNSSDAQHFRPLFTTTNPDFDAMGEIASEMLLDAIEQNEMPAQTYILPVPLLIRDQADQDNASVSQVFGAPYSEEPATV